jgi:hypothetical protein
VYCTWDLASIISTAVIYPTLTCVSYNERQIMLHLISAASRTTTCSICRLWISLLSPQFPAFTCMATPSVPRRVQCSGKGCPTAHRYNCSGCNAAAYVTATSSCSLKAFSLSYISTRSIFPSIFSPMAASLASHSACPVCAPYCPLGELP